MAQVPSRSVNRETAHLIIEHDGDMDVRVTLTALGLDTTAEDWAPATLPCDLGNGMTAVRRHYGELIAIYAQPGSLVRITLWRD